MLRYSIGQNGIFGSLFLDVKTPHETAEIQFEQDNVRTRRMKRGFEEGYIGMFGRSFRKYATALDLNHAITTHRDFKDVTLVEGEEIFEAYKKERKDPSKIY